MKFILSTEDKNSYGFIVKSDGISIPKNLPLFLNHNPDKVIGEWKDVINEDNKLIGDAIFDDDDPEALKIKKKVEKGLINGSSIGFTIKEREFLDDGTMIVTKSRLREASITPIPANEQAVKLFNEDGVELTDEAIISLSMENKNKQQDMDTIKQLLDMLGVDEDKIVEAVKGLKDSVSAIETNIEEKQTLINSNSDEYQLSLTERDAKITELNVELQGMKDKELEGEISGMIDVAIEEGKILEAQKDEYTTLSKTNFDLVKSIFEKSPKINHNKITELIGDDKIELKKSPKDSWTFNDWSRKDPKGLIEIKLNDQERYDTLYGESFFD